MYETLTLSALREGESGYVTGISAGNAMACRLTDLGLIKGTQVTCVAESPAGDPRAYLVRGTLIALRQRDTDGIRLVRHCPPAAAAGMA